MSKFTRVEVIDPEGRVFTRYYDEPMEARAAIQDSGATLKLFIDKVDSSSS